MGCPLIFKLLKYVYTYRLPKVKKSCKVASADAKFVKSNDFIFGSLDK